MRTFGLILLLATSILAQNFLGGDGGFHDALGTASKEQLMMWALTTEAYHRDINHQHLMGGLDDYISSLSRDQIVSYILKETKEHPELANTDKLNSLGQKYNISANAIHSDDQSMGINLPKTIENILAYSDRSTINKYALASEKYFREMKGVRLMGGLHDYISTLTNDQVINYILEKSQIYPELGNISYLASLVQKYNITDETAHGHVVGIATPSTMIKLPDAIESLKGPHTSPLMMTSVDNLNDIIANLDSKTLLAYGYALATFEQRQRTIYADGKYVCGYDNQKLILLIQYLVRQYKITNENQLKLLVASYGTTC